MGRLDGAGMRTTQLAAFTLLGLAIFAIAPKHDADVRPGPQQRAPHGASSRPRGIEARRSERAAIRLISAVAAAILLSVSIPAASREATPARHDSAWPGVTIGPASDAWTRRVEWGLGRFREAGLQLPPMVITVHDDDASCEGNSGLFLPNDPWRSISARG